MKSTRYLPHTIGLVLSLGCFTSHAADWLDRMYVRTDVGPSFTEDTSATTTVVFPISGHSVSPVRFTGGIRGDVSLGYQLTKPLAVELEGGAIWNEVQYTPDGTIQIPVTANLLYQVPLGKSWKAYFGGGAGETISKFEVLFWAGAFQAPDRLQGNSLAFTYQAQAGIQHSLSRHVDIGLGYKFTHVDPNEWHPFQGFQGTERIESLNNHMVLLSATYKF